MENKSKKQLADAIATALFGSEYISKNGSDEHERLGFVTIGDGLAQREPVLLYVSSNGVMVQWMNNEALEMDDDGMEIFLKGVVFAADKQLQLEFRDGREMTFSYIDSGE